jgi:lon-related putative ATP-dependent protease
MRNENKYQLTPDKLSSEIPETWLEFRTTNELSSSRGIIGQDRAMRAVDIGLKISTRGFNIFAVGEPGSGKTSTLERILKERAQSEPVPDDLCYVYNFNTPEQPRPLLLPAGKGRELAKDLERVVKELERMIPRVLSEGALGHIRAGILAETRKRASDLLKRASKAAEKLGLKIEEDADNLRVIALENGVPLDDDTFDKLPKGKRNRIEANLMAFQEHLDAFTYGRRQLERDHRKQVLDAEIRMVTPIVKDLIDELASRYKKYNHSLVDFLLEVRESVLENHRAFMPLEEEGENGDERMTEEPPPIDPNRIYQVNVVVDRTSQEGAPVVVERVPNAANLSGYFEYRETQGGLVTDHTMIRAGALHQSCGGYLLLQAGELLSHENAWDSLKRAIRHKEIRVDEGFGPGDGRPRIAGMMKPGTVALNLKVILVGTPESFYFLRLEDEEFGRLFKIKADFEPTMARTKSTVTKLAGFLGQVCQEEGHLPLHRTGIVRLVEFASRQAGHKARMTTRRAALLDLLAEANAGALKRQARSIQVEDIQKALDNKAQRDGSLVDALDREIKEGTILLQTRGRTVGQVNGIALYDMMSSSFGIPVRITASTYAGRRGVVNIDREVRLSGAIHDKGALILIGYLGGRYAKQQTLGFSASITFEQSYDEIDGDSASAAELYALLSALSGCPIRQGIAVTGSVNQLGEIQPIGGVNEKIEGVFRVCQIQGLTGRQGVVIPKSNIKNLMLSREVVDAVKKGEFNIFAITTIDQGIEVLTGKPAGRMRKDGTWTPGSINDLVQRRLADLQDAVRREGIVTSFHQPL